MQPVAGSVDAACLHVGSLLPDVGLEPAFF